MPKKPPMMINLDDWPSWFGNTVPVFWTENGGLVLAPGYVVFNTIVLTLFGGKQWVN